MKSYHSIKKLFYRAISRILTRLGLLIFFLAALSLIYYLGGKGSYVPNIWKSLGGIKIEDGVLASGKQGPHKVIKVVDGDTLDIEINGKTERVRLLGINTPETVDPRKTVECFGKEASEKAREILTGKSVFIEGDNTQLNRDKYDRLLRYIYLEEGTFFNKMMIGEGYAYEYTYEIPYKYREEFKKAQTEAMNQEKGIWSKSAGCAQK